MYAQTLDYLKRDGETSDRVATSGGAYRLTYKVSLDNQDSCSPRSRLPMGRLRFLFVDFHACQGFHQPWHNLLAPLDIHKELPADATLQNLFVVFTVQPKRIF